MKDIIKTYTDNICVNCKAECTKRNSSNQG